MSKKFLVRALAAACLLAFPAGSFGSGSTGCTVSITGTVDAFAAWSNATPSIINSDWDGHITAVDTAQTVTKSLTLYTNADVTITPTTADATNGILTNGTQTLITSYKLTGAPLTAPDAAYKLAGAGAGQFFNAGNTYALTHVAGTGSYNINLVVQMQSQLHLAPDAGDYATAVTLTASW